MLKCKDVVIGGSFDAVYLAFTEGYPILYKELEKPFEHDRIGSKSKKEAFEMMVFLLTLANLNPFGSKITDIRMENDRIVVSGEKPWIYEIKADNIHDFTKSDTKLFKVVDYIKLRTMGNHPFKGFKTKDKFVSEIHIDIDNRRKQSARVISYLTAKQLNKEEYSGVYSRIKVKQIFKDNGIKGNLKCIETRPGFAKGQRWTPPYLEFTRREIFKIDKEDKEYCLESKHPYIQKLMYLMNGTRKSSTKKKLPPSWNHTS